jgi:hypothetical protein
MVTGKSVFPRPSSMAAAFRRITPPPPFPGELVAHLSPEWETAVQGLLTDRSHPSVSECNGRDRGD